MKKILVAFLVLSAFLIGCGNNSTTKPHDTTDIQPLSFVQLTHLAKVTGAYTLEDAESAPIELNGNFIDLGEAFTKTEWQFLLQNNGNTAITNLTIESDDSSFSVTPDSINTLAAPNTENGMLPIITVTFEHGLNKSELGRTDVRTGDNYATITLTGETADSTFTVQYVFKVHANRMYIKADTVTLAYVVTNVDENGLRTIKHVNSKGDTTTTILLGKLPAPDSTIVHTYGEQGQNERSPIPSSITSAEMNVNDTIYLKYKRYTVDATSDNCYLDVETQTGTYTLSVNGYNEFYGSLDLVNFEIPLTPTTSGELINRQATTNIDANCVVYMENTVVNLW